VTHGALLSGLDGAYATNLKDVKVIALDRNLLLLGEEKFVIVGSI